MPTMTTILIETALKGIALTLLALLTLAILRDAAPSLRHRVALTAFALLALLPLGAFLPGWNLTALRFRPLTDKPAIAVPSPIVSATESTPALLPPQPAPAFPEIAAPPSAPAVESAPRLMPYFWPRTLIGFWAISAAFSLLSLTMGLIRLSRLRRASCPADPARQALSDEAANALSISAPALRLCEELRVPLVCGVRHPMILLPAPAASWEDSRLRAALLHESAHIARRDFAVQTFARIVCALYAWNPLVWRLFSLLRAEAEADCDRRAIAAGIAATDYAHHLFEIARHAAAPNVMAPAMAHSNQPAVLEKRIRVILTPGGSLTRRRAALAAVGLLFALPALTLRPAVLASQQPPAPPSSQNAVLDAQYPASTVPAPVGDPAAFLKWSMDRYASVKTFRADWTWDTAYSGLPKPEKGKEVVPGHRTLVYAAPNQFKIVSRMYEKLSHTYISDGTRMVIIKRGYGQGPDEYSAPPSLAKADRYTLPGGGVWGFTPDDGGSALYRFFGGAAGLPHLLDAELLEQTKENVKTNKTPGYEQYARQTISRLSDPMIHFGEDVTVGGEPCKTVIFNGGMYYDERRAAISVRDGFIRRIQYFSAGRKNSEAGKKDLIQRREETMALPMVQKMPEADRKKLFAALTSSIDRSPDALSADIFSNIRINEPVVGSEFDTSVNYPSVGEMAPEITVYEQTSGKPLRLSDLQGKFALLVFSSHETSADDAFLLTLPKMASQLNLDGVAFIPITPQVKVLPEGLALYRDPTDAAYNALDISAYTPGFVLLDREGKIAYRGKDAESLKEIKDALTAAGITQ